jgi:alkylation response protein AidB-like acyl-CoA dehydrogenase
MNFRAEYSEQQQAFRSVVRTWMEHHAPRGLDVPGDGSPIAPDAQERIKDFRRALGSQGWLAPTYPREIGGAGLTSPLAAIIVEEIQRLELPSMGDNSRWIPAMMVWGTNDQRRRYLIPALRGETITWQLFNEPGSGSDLAAVQTRATPDGDGFVLSGEKAFITGRFDPDYLWTLVVTDPNRPRHMNLGLLMVDARLPGIVVKTQRLLMRSERRVYLNDVRVPGDCLVGGPFQGWEIAQTILEGERGGFAFRVTEEGTMESINQFLQEERERS